MSSIATDISVALGNIGATVWNSTGTAAIN